MAGRKELLTEKVAKQICKMIECMPDAEIPVTWENVAIHAQRKIGHGFTRQMLSQKEWSGRKLIAEAFAEAKAVQKRLRLDFAPKYSTSPRSTLQKRIAELEAKNLALQEELENVRAHQLEVLDTFLMTPRDLRQVLAEDPKQLKPGTAKILPMSD